VTTIANADAPLVQDKRVLFLRPVCRAGVEWNGPSYSPSPRPCSSATGSTGATPRPSARRHRAAARYLVRWLLRLVGEPRGWIKALDAATGRELWVLSTAPSLAVGGVTATAGGVVMAGLSSGTSWSFDAKSGQILYQFYTGGAVGGGVSTYAVGGQQYVAWQAAAGAS